MSIKCYPRGYGWGHWLKWRTYVASAAARAVHAGRNGLRERGEVSFTTKRSTHDDQPPAPRRGLPLYNFSRLLSNRLELPRPSGPAGLGACGGLLGSLSNGLKLNYANSDDPPPRPLLCLLHRADLASWRGPARWVSSRSGWLGAF